MKIGSSFVISVSWEDYDDEIGGIVTLRRRSDRDYEGKRFFGHQSFGSNWFFWIGKALGVFEEGFPRLMVMELGRLDRLVNQRYQGSYKEGVVLAIIQTLLNYCSRYAFSDLEKRINVGQYLDFYWICSFGLIIVVSMEPPLMERYGIWVDLYEDFTFGKFLKSVIEFFSSLVQSWVIWAMIHADLPFQYGDSRHITLLIVIREISILLEWKFDIDCVSAYIYTKDNGLWFHHSHSRYSLTFFFLSCSLCTWSVMSQGQWLVKSGGKKVRLQVWD